MKNIQIPSHILFHIYFSKITWVSIIWIIDYLIDTGVPSFQTDYLRTISTKMLTMEIKFQNTMANNMPSNEGGPRNNLPDQGKHVFSGELVVVYRYDTKVGKSYLIIYIFKNEKCLFNYLL
jgi:hypothetical protein